MPGCRPRFGAGQVEAGNTNGLMTDDEGKARRRRSRGGNNQPRFLPKRLAFALTVRNAGFNAAAATAVAACGDFLPPMALAAIRIASLWAATIPDVAAVTFSETIRFNSTLSLDGVAAAMRIGHRHHSVMLVSTNAAPRSIAN